MGKRLLKWGMEKADEKGLECWVNIASEAAVGFFEGFGWKRVGCVEGDLGEWGGEEGERERVVWCIGGPGGEMLSWGYYIGPKSGGLSVLCVHSSARPWYMSDSFSLRRWLDRMLKGWFQCQTVDIQSIKTIECPRN